jgi:peptidoglycan/xylan/chitin deacetylase (PgdA/CDA1 family)
MRKSHLLASALLKLSATRLADTLWGIDRLTVLVYHRIADPDAPNFRYFRRNVSATPEMFRRQMAYVAEHFNVIDLVMLQEFILRGCPLPPRPLLITFDDGYLDNYTNAYPVLRDCGFPAVIFLITNHMDHPMPPWWDQCAYFFEHTHKVQAQLPFIGEYDLATTEQRRAVCYIFNEKVKRVPEVYKQRAMHELQTILDVPLPSEDHSLFLSWQHVRELVANGIACQPHTATHPILSQVDYTEMARQLYESRCRIEAETNQVATAFAYPNGMTGDYTPDTLRVLREAGFVVAFTHKPGPMHAVTARQHPLEISRVPVDSRDTFEMFAMHVMGLLNAWRRPAFVPDRVARPDETQAAPGCLLPLAQRREQP